MDWKNGFKGLIFGVGIGLCALGVTASYGAERELRIGNIASLTGPAAPFGVPEVAAIKYLAEKANKAGGIDGYKVVVFVADDKTNPTDAAKAAQRLIEGDHVDVILGPTTGNGGLAVGPVAKAGKVPVLCPCGTINLTDKDSGFFDWMFRSTLGQGDELKQTMSIVKSKGYKRIGLYFQQDAYGKAAAEDIKNSVKKMEDTKIVVEASSPLSATDLAAQATRLTAAKPDVILLMGDIPAAGAALMRGLRQVGSTAPVIAAGGMGSNAFISNAQGAAEGVTVVGTASWDKPTAEQEQFIKGFGMPKTIGEGIAGTGFLAVAAAMKNLKGPLNGESLRDALERTCGFATLIGAPGCYSKTNHDGFTALRTQVVKGNEFVTVAN